TEEAVFVVPGKETLNSLLHEVSQTSQRAPTAVQQLYNAVIANNFQITSSSSASTNVLTAKYYNVIARLSSYERNAPTLMFVAYYDSHSAVPSLSVGADSNGSGIAALLELLAIFQRFYTNPSNRPKFNMIFLLSAGGKFNYQGSRQFLDDYLEKQTDEHIELVICLDALGRENNLFAHVSKFPPEGSASAKLFERLKIFSNDKHKVDLVTKKINLGNEWLAWEHEIYNIRRMPAMTLSHFEKFTDPRRNSMLDTLASVDVEVLSTNVHILANSVLAYIFDLDIDACQNLEHPDQRCSLLEAKDVNRARLQGFLEAFGGNPRPMATTSLKLVKELAETAQKYSTGRVVQQEVLLVDLQLYGVLEDKLIAHIVKPSVFELLLAAGIGAYMYSLYYLAQNAQLILETAVVRLRKMVS
uniref:BOS complex subunit NCLN n=1 Tax=Acrobeloides nanus TaxID=290746 RepID=A0A914CII5_9BILA